jgi:hypothetical protein
MQSTSAHAARANTASEITQLTNPVRLTTPPAYGGRVPNGRTAAVGV